MSRYIAIVKDNYLSHKAYANPYYDPVYMHNYYMQHRKLKRKGLNKTGQELDDNERTRLKTEMQRDIKRHKERTDNNIESHRQRTNSTIKRSRESTKMLKERNLESKRRTLDSHAVSMNKQIDALKKSLKAEGLTRSQKSKRNEEVKEKIAKLRELNRATREKLGLTTAKKNSALSEQHKSRSDSQREAHRTAKITYRTKHKRYKEDRKAQFEREHLSSLNKLHSQGDRYLKKPKKS